jgi:DNA-binding transcriptional regulator YbjK
LDKQTILNAGVELAKTRGYCNVFKRNIATTLGCAMGTVNYHWETMNALRRAIVMEALSTGCREIVAQAVAMCDPIVKRENLSRAQRQKLDALSVA